jgi:hypothetical protein
MNAFGGSKPATLSPAKPANSPAIAPAPVRRRRKAIVGALLLGLIGAIGLNAYVFANAPRITPSYGFSDVQQIYSEGQTLDKQHPAPLD